MNNPKLRNNVPDVATVQSRHKLALGLNIRRYTTDANGTILNDATLPASVRKNYPFHILGEFDRQGGFAIADQILSKINNTILFGVYVWGINTPLFFFSPLANINAKFQKGDMIFIYVDDINAPTYFTFVQVNSVDGAHASILSQTSVTQLSKEKWGAFAMYEMQYQWIHDSQLNENIYELKTTFDSRYTYDQIEPYSFFNPQINKQKKIVVPLKDGIVVNQFYGLSSFIAFENSLLTLQLIIYV